MTAVINFIRFRFAAVGLSLVLILAGGVATVVQGGFNFGVDFRAGLAMQVKIEPRATAAPIEEVRRALADLEGAQIQIVGDPAAQEFAVRTKQVGDDPSYNERTRDEVTRALEQAFGAGNVTLLRSDYVGPRFSADLATQTAFLTTFALLLIMLYAWFRFKLAYAVAAIVATLHDSFFMLAFIGAFQLEASTATVAAVLTVIGYSINDTIVIFDRIRENEHLLRETGFAHIINASVTQTLSRTIVTSLTTLLAIVAIFIFTTGEVQNFAINMIVGILVGTYSSVFVASPVLFALRGLSERRGENDEPKKVVEAPRIVAGPDAPVVEQDQTEGPRESAVGVATLGPRKPKGSREKRKRRAPR